MSWLSLDTDLLFVITFQTFILGLVVLIWVMNQILWIWVMQRGMVLITWLIDFFPSNYFCCFIFNRFRIKNFVYVLFSNLKLSSHPLKVQNTPQKSLEQFFFSRFASLCTEIIHKVSQKRLNQVKVFQFELLQ